MPTFSFQPGVSVSGQLALGASPAHQPVAVRSAPLRPVEGRRRGLGRRGQEARGDGQEQHAANAHHTSGRNPWHPTPSAATRAPACRSTADAARRETTRPTAATAASSSSTGASDGSVARSARPGSVATSAAPVPIPRPSSSKQRRLREHQGPHVARAVADRAQQRELAALLEGVADQDRPDAERPEQQAQAAERLERGDVGVLDAVEGRETGRRRLGVEAEVREARLERFDHRRLAAGLGLDQEEAIAFVVRERGLEVALARHELGLQQSRPQRAHDLHPHARCRRAPTSRRAAGGARTRAHPRPRSRGSPRPARRARAAATGWPSLAGRRGEAASGTRSVPRPGSWPRVRSASAARADTG